MLRLAQVVPLRVGRAAGSGLARLAWHLRPAERRLATANLARALPELGVDERQGILRDAKVYLGRNLFHTLAAPRLVRNSQAVIEDVSVGADNQSIGAWLSELAAPGRGVLIVTGHLGCWELAGAWVARILAERGLGRLGVVTGTIHNPAVNRLLQRHRRALGLQVLPRESGAAPLVRFLKQGGVVAVLPDQQTRSRNLDVPFFGLPAPTPVGVAALALKYGISVLPVAGVWDEERRAQIMRCQPPLRPKEFAPNDQRGFLTQVNLALEIFIRRNPEQWVWFHRRWKPEP